MTTAKMRREITGPEQTAPLDTLTLPDDLRDAVKSLTVALGRRDELLQRQTALVAKQPEAKKAAEVAAVALEAASVELSLCTDESHQWHLDRRDEARAAATDSAEALEMLGRAKRGIIVKLDEADDAIVAAHAAFAVAVNPFRIALCRYWRELFLQGPLVDALRLAYGLTAHWRGCGLAQVIQGLKMADPLPQTGRTPLIIDGPMMWVDPDASAAVDLRESYDNPAAHKLFAMVRGVGAVEHAGAARSRAVQIERMHRPVPPPAPAPPAAPEPPVTDEQLRAERLERDQRRRVYPAYQAGIRSYHNPETAR
jgi:hypothetical protein